MAFDKPIRNRLASFVGKVRDLIANEFTQQFQSLYGISNSGTITPLEQLNHLDDAGLATAAFLRERINYLIKTHPNDRDGTKAAVTRLAREQAFTVLNRLAAIRMAEIRGIIVESVGNGYQSKGFKVFEQVAGSSLGETYHRYRRFIFCLFDELAIDLGVLFDRRSPQGLLFPREPALQDLFTLLNNSDLVPLWAEDETIGWIYQFYNDPDERKKMRDESAAPRDSRELAVRNQFFTPRYVVEFLTDNTLGRIWYEMTQGGTSLKDTCRYMVRRMDEVFFDDKNLHADAPAKRWLKGEDDDIPSAYDLACTVDAYMRHNPIEMANKWLYENIACVSAEETETFTTQDLLDLLFLLHRTDHFSEGTLDHYATEIKRIMAVLGERRAHNDIAGLSQEELLNQPVYIPFREIKDPRELLMLDPACGSMHFGLYAFDLFEAIYEEAWDRGLESLHRDYPEKDTLLREVPRMIIEHNIHGIDIDPRAVQIAGLALWLRAQKSWQAQCVSVAKRPRITRSNIVCAEPMPGSPEMLKEFSATLHPPLLGQLVAKIFDQMKLAGEAGSLLKIEEEITVLVAEAKKLWSSPRKIEQTIFDLGIAGELKQEEFPLDLSGIADEQFWETAEERIYYFLKDYAEQAESSGYQRRLFAEDASRGFAFIDICRQRYDVVLMNPPYGEAAVNVEGYLTDKYADGNNDIFLPFVERALNIGNPFMLCGALTSRNFMFNQRMSDFRKSCILGQGAIDLLADLGNNVLDAAVDVAAFVIAKNSGERSARTGLFFDMVNKEDRGGRLLIKIDQVRSGSVSSDIFQRPIGFFLKLPDCRLSYSAPKSLVSLFQEFPKLAPTYGLVLKGLITGSDERYVRAWQECPPMSSDWQWFHKGGDYSPYYSDLELKLNWGVDGSELKVDAEAKYGSATRTIKNESFFGKPSLAWGVNNSIGFAVKVIPSNCVFADIGPVFQPNDMQLIYQWLGFLNAETIKVILRLFQSGDRGRFMWIANIVEQIPCPIKDISLECGRIASDVLHIFIQHATSSEASPLFTVAEFKWDCLSLATVYSNIKDVLIKHSEEIEQLSRQLDDMVIASFDRDLSDTSGIKNLITKDEHASDVLIRRFSCTMEDISRRCINYALGCAFGRWDIRFATGERQPPEIIDPLAPLPVCPPGMLQNFKGLPAEPKDVPDDYPLRITWPGILVDDDNHSQDIVARVRETLEVIWKDRADAIEQEACELLGVKTFREYFRRNSGFFADHLKRFSKSRRQAPIYWPLSTADGSYTLWIYYHRLSDQTLHTVLADFVEPKLKAIRAEISELQKSGKHRNHLEEMQDQEKKLADFHDEIERIIKLPWKPNLNDGVLITASPLWKLFRLPKWQKDLKACWEKLEKGHYDWAHMAYSIWPERVEKTCKKDRSIAIAHNLEHLFEAIPSKVKGKRKKATAP